MKRAIEERVSLAINSRVFPGCVVGIATSSGEKNVFPFGNFTYEADSPKIREDSVFDVASVTKVIPTSCLALRLVDQGLLGLDDLLIRYLPEYDAPHREHVRVRHLLTQTLDFDTPLSQLKNNTPEALLKAILVMPLKTAPGSRFSYTNATSVLLGLLIERVMVDRLDHLAEREYFKPLEMIRTTFNSEKFDSKEIVPTEFDSWRGRIIQGEIHDESAYILRKMMVPGSAGLFSTVPDLLNFLEMMMKNGKWGGKTYFSDGIIRQMVTKQIDGKGGTMGLGWELNQPRFMGRSCSDKTIGKTGFTGCVIVCDMEKGVGITILSNYVYPKRKSDAVLINQVRSDICDIVYQYVKKC